MTVSVSEKRIGGILSAQTASITIPNLQCVLHPNDPVPEPFSTKQDRLCVVKSRLYELLEVQKKKQAMEDNKIRHQAAEFAMSLMAPH